MPTPLLLPPTIPYPSTDYVTFGAAMKQPKECRVLPLQFQWSLVSALTPGYLVEVPPTPGGIDQITTLFVDNTRSSSGVVIIFPDSQWRIVVPPFWKGYYPAVTNSLRLYVGVFNPTGVTSADRTNILALNYLVPPQDGEALMLSSHFSLSYDSSVAQGSTLINTLPAGSAFTGGNWRMRELAVQLAGMTAGAGGFAAEFRCFADGVRIIKADVILAANEFVDANMLVIRENMRQAAKLFTFDWLISAGALTGVGIANVDAELEFANVI